MVAASYFSPLSCSGRLLAVRNTVCSSRVVSPAPLLSFCRGEGSGFVQSRVGHEAMRSRSSLLCCPWGFSPELLYCERYLRRGLDSIMRMGRGKTKIAASSSVESSPTSTKSSTEAAPSSRPWLLVGLGNPGSKFEGTRHNVGMDMVDAIAQAEGITMNAVEHRALIGKGRICGLPVILAKPQTYMNLAGESVGPLASYYKIPVEQVLVMYDDMDLDVGILKLLPKGGHGGHNGMKSVIQHLRGKREFPRLRIGVGRPSGSMNVAAYVLQKFDKRDREEIDFVIARGREAVRLIMVEGLVKAVSKWNTPRVRPTATASDVRLL